MSKRKRKAEFDPTKPLKGKSSWMLEKDEHGDRLYPPSAIFDQPLRVEPPSRRKRIRLKMFDK
jgi:hypothetical protein